MKKPLKKENKVFVGMSGGVDSSLSAALLQEQGFDVTGVYMRNWSDDDHRHYAAASAVASNEVSGCHWEEDVEDARKVAAKLHIPFYVWNFTKEYKERVVDYMIEGYKNGITPNPDIMCNKEIKFGIFLEKALEAGADFVATGHYVRRGPVIASEPGERGNLALHPSEKEEIASSHRLLAMTKNTENLLLKGIDPNKDQSYFLHRITQEQLSKSLFPIGELEKSKTREMAKERGLHVWDKKDSQGICFIGKVKIQSFLTKRIKENPGDIILKEEVVGKHKGLSFYTIGQREGIEVAGPVPYYVAGKDFKNNRLILAKGNMDESLYGKELIAIDTHWISGTEPTLPMECDGMIRYRQKPEKCLVTQQKDESLKVVFSSDQRAITPGQRVVFYNEDECLGGAIIKE